MMSNPFCSSTRQQGIFCQPQTLTESIYNLVPKPERHLEKPPRYKSRYNSAVKDFYESIKSDHKTMGYFKTPLIPPNEYLKKHSKEPKLEKQPVKPFTYPDEERRKPAVPPHDVSLTFVDDSEKNHVRENMRNIVRKPATKPVRKIADTKKGDTLLLEYSGLVPKFCTKQEFGQTPRYLSKRQEDMEYSTKMYENFVKEQCAKRAPVRISDEERKKMIKGLRDNWNELNKNYLGLPLCTDTIRKKAHKEELEFKLSRIEKELDLLEKHEDLYIYDENY